MHPSAPSTTARSGLGLAALLVALAACLAPSTARSQNIVWDRSMEGDSVKVWDYYARDYFEGAREWVRTVEYNHLAETNFWREYREGHFGEARGDLHYVLRFVPNHPKALYLVAFDPNLTEQPSLVVQYFERALRSFPQRAYTYALYGKYMASIGRKSVGLTLLDQALRLDPNLVVALAWREELKRGGAPPAGRPTPDATPGEGSQGSSAKSPPSRR